LDSFFYLPLTGLNKPVPINRFKNGTGLLKAIIEREFLICQKDIFLSKQNKASHWQIYGNGTHKTG